MRKPSPIQLVLFMASVAKAADSTCAIDCFQGLITNGPPDGCKEATNYLCFCTMPTLQNNFVQCTDKTCGNEKDKAMTWADDLCSKLGKPIDLGGSGGSPKPSETTAVEVPPTTSDKAKPTTEVEKTTADAAPTTATEAKTEPKAGETSSGETEAPFETSAAVSTPTSIKSTVSKAKETEKSDASGSAAEATADKTSDDGSVVTITGSGDSATSTPSSTGDSNAAEAVAPGSFVAAGVMVALWQLL